MKTYITFFSFLIISFAGVQQSVAQQEEKKFVSNTEKEVTLEQRVKLDVYNMGRVMDLTADQKEDLRILFTEIDEKKAKVIVNEKNADKRKNELVRVNEAKTQRLKQILTEEQYNEYLKML